ncbi:excinuclease ABC subunit B [Staphylococcus simulans]|nr:excinuclease ABC subunit B [Staphylococcus simulans]
MADTFAHGTKTNALKSQEHNRIKAQSNEEEPTWQNNQDDMEGSFVIKQILQHLASKHGIQLEDLSVREEKKCPTCHMTMKDIAYKGKFGCAQCYTTFKEDIVDIVRRVQGGQFEHVGKTPVSFQHKLALKKKIEAKNKYLQELIEQQAFEEAAVVRDEIKALQEESEG